MKKLLMLLVFSLITTATSYAKKPVICGSNWPVWEVVHAMAELNQIDEFEYRYEKYETCVAAFQSGVRDMTFVTLYDFISMQRVKNNGVILAATDYSSGGDGVVLHGNSGSLNGKKLGLQSNSISLYFTHLFLKKQGLSLNDIQIINVSSDKVSEAFLKNKQLAGVVGWNPNLDEAIKGGGKLTATSADFPENIFDLVVVNRDAYKQNPELYLNFVKKYFNAVNDKAILAKMAALSQVPVKEFELWLSDAHIYQDAASSLAAFPRMKTVADEVQAFFKTPPKSLKGRIRKSFGDVSLNTEQLFDDSVLKKLK
ncbi:ABC transporter substrate-binding protein [Thalassomonas actiniarum]|uniref:ABC transporter substrate-binding protein n=1 Tax=Thalassomonas actiniarum TaxID=485447 RepID=A0AAE9YNQ3_9GAMM|nr:ABC transporter substrate-binding protein [Thalassomonas actiniarum]WDD96797.1 ABC transporter substrate-binding protein [Thalassomonas actiniarum]